jgi:hypothetical protein
VNLCGRVTRSLNWRRPTGANFNGLATTQPSGLIDFLQQSFATLPTINKPATESRFADPFCG